MKIEIDTATLGATLGHALQWCVVKAVGAVRAMLPGVGQAVLTALLVVWLTGGLVLPTGCHGPVPPPPPPAPDPTDPLVKEFQAAYDADTDAGKAADLPALASLYGSVVTQARASGNVTTLAQLQAAVHAAADLVTGPGKMQALRLAVSHHVASKMPAQDGPMTDQLWLSAASAYGEAAAAIKQVRSK